MLRAAVALLVLASAAQAEDLRIEDAYARGPASSGAAFMAIHNDGEQADRLIGAETGAAARVELHTHSMSADGVMTMRPVEGGIEVPAGGAAMLERGGDHVMLMGLAAPLQDGGTVDLTLIFERAGRVEVAVPVDNARMPAGH
jgi:copper(I)-binding protein